MPDQESSTLPVLRARPGGPAERFAGRIGGSHPAATFFAALLLGFVVLAGLAILLGLVVTDVLVRDLGLGGADQDAVEQTRRGAVLVPDRRRLRRRVHGRRPAAAGPRRPGRARRRLQARLARRRLRGLRALRRVRHLPRRLDGDPARAPRRQAPRGPARGRELPVRPHGRVARRLRRARAAPHHAGEGRAGADRPLGAGRDPPALRRLLAHVPGHAPPARRDERPAHRRGRDHRPAVRLPLGRGRGPRPGPCARPAARPPASRRPREGRGRRTRREGARRRAARAAARARGGGDRRSALVRGAQGQEGAQAGAPRAGRGRGARVRLGRRRHRAPLHRRAGGRGRAAGRAPRRHGEPLRDEPRHPGGHRAGGRGRAARRRAGASTSAASPASASP